MADAVPARAEARRRQAGEAAGTFVVDSEVLDRGDDTTGSDAGQLDLPSVEATRYVIQRQIARGGMGRILAAYDRRLERSIAIKMLLTREPTIERRFHREVKITARLQHPAIINLYEGGRWTSGEPFYIMKQVKGRPLDEIIAERATLDQRIALLPNVIAVADALAYAHTEGVIHRDLKPQNVLVGDFGETVVIDWGLAKDLRNEVDDAPLPEGADPADNLTVEGRALGTPLYMPPEQARGRPADERADVYAIGAMLYHLLSGRPPYVDKGSAHEIIKAVAAGPTVPLREIEPGAPSELLTIVEKAMAHAPEARYSSAKELARDLEHFTTGQLVGAHRYSTLQLIGRWLGRHRAVMGMATVMVVLLALVGALSFRRITSERDRAEQQEVLAEKNQMQVEELLGFMLGDLHDKLRPIGKTDLLGTVARKAVAYYAERPIDWSRPGAVRRRASAHLALGDVLRDQGDVAAALIEYGAANMLREQLVAMDANNSDWQHDLMVSHNRVGNMLHDQGDLGGALVEYRAGLAIAQRWLATDSANPAWLNDLSISRDNVGNVLRAQGDLAGALVEYQASKVIRERLVALDPENVKWQNNLAVSHNMVGNARLAQGDLGKALVDYRAGKAVREQLVAMDPENSGWQRNLSVSHNMVGNMLRAKGDLAGALAEYQASRRIREQLVEIDPENAGWQRDLSVSHNEVGDVLRTRGDMAAALAEYQAGKAIRERLVAMDPKNAGWQLDLAVSHDRAGSVLRAQGDPAKALVEYQASVAILERLVAMNPKNAGWQRIFANVLTATAGAHQQVGDRSAARQHLDRAVALHERFAKNAKDFYNAACAYASAGALEPALAMLDQAVEHGFRDVEWMQSDPDLAPLRKDPRWKSFIAKIETK